MIEEYIRDHGICCIRPAGLGECIVHSTSGMLDANIHSPLIIVCVLRKWEIGVAYSTLTVYQFASWCPTLVGGGCFPHVFM